MWYRAPVHDAARNSISPRAGNLSVFVIPPEKKSILESALMSGTIFAYSLLVLNEIASRAEIALDCLSTGSLICAAPLYVLYGIGLFAG